MAQPANPATWPVGMCTALIHFILSRWMEGARRVARREARAWRESVRWERGSMASQKEGKQV